MPDSLMRGLVVRASAAEPTRGALPGAVIAQLGSGLRLIPLTDAVLSSFTGAADPISELPISLLDAVRAAIGSDPMLYYRLDHDRQQDQLAVLWRGPDVVKGPARINTALEAMGIDADRGRDAMTTVGLRRFRDLSSFAAGQTIAEASRPRPAVRPMSTPPPAPSGGGLRRWIPALFVLVAVLAFVGWAGGLGPAIELLRSLLDAG
jgi:hypothetical protein